MLAERLLDLLVRAYILGLAFFPGATCQGRQRLGAPLEIADAQPQHGPQHVFQQLVAWQRRQALGRGLQLGQQGILCPACAGPAVGIELASHQRRVESIAGL